MKHHKCPFLIGLTGGIASGKSLAAAYFKKRGFTIISTDDITHKILLRPDIIDKIVTIFGSEVVENNRLIRKKIGSIVFKDVNSREQLNSIIHPEVRSELQNIIDKSKEKYLIIEIPLLFENNLEAGFDLTVNVFTDEDIQCSRLMQRNKLNSSEAILRIASQMGKDEKIRRADFNLENLSNKDVLYCQIDEFIISLEKRKMKKILRFTEL